MNNFSSIIIIGIIEKMEAVAKVKNPTTGRMITVGGDAYNKLIASGYKLVAGVLQPPNQQVQMPPVVVPTQTTVMVPIPQTRPPVIVPPTQVIVLTKVVEGAIPTLGTLEIELDRIMKEETAAQVRLCNTCKEYYMDRWMPFTVKELKNLNKIVQACTECSKLCEINQAREKVPNPQKCQPYKAAGIAGHKQEIRLESQIAAEQIRLGLMTGKDVGQYFPKPGK
jgi:hypothetical protein